MTLALAPARPNDAGTTLPSADASPGIELPDTTKPAIATGRLQGALSFFAHRKWVIGLLVAAVAVIAYLAFRHFQGTVVTVDAVQRADLVETVVASGHVESPFRVVIASQVTGTVASVVVHEGETVRAGQPLILLSAGELQSSASEARATVAQAEAQVRQISEVSLPQAMEAQRSAASSLLATQQIYDRASVLMTKGFVTRAYFDEVKKNRNVARTQVATAAAQVQSARAGGSNFASAQAGLAQARAGSSAAASRLGYTTITAPRAGVLISRSVERGTVVTPGTPLMVLAPGTASQIVLQIDERNLGKVAVGQSAIVSADAYPNQRFAAVITFINPGVDIARASATVKLTVANPPAYLRQDMTVSVDVQTARRNAVLSLPGSSVRDALSSTPWVMTVENGKAVRRNVRLGLQGNNRIELVGGVAQGTIVIPVASPVLAGARVSTSAK